MSEADILAKYRWYSKCVMESPIDSDERKVWVHIVRDFEMLIKKTAEATAVR